MGCPSAHQPGAHDQTSLPLISSFPLLYPLQSYTQSRNREIFVVDKQIHFPGFPFEFLFEFTGTYYHNCAMYPLLLTLGRSYRLYVLNI